MNQAGKFVACVSIALAAICAPGSARADGAYDIVISGEVRGEMRVETRSDVRRVRFRYVDRGRGPELQSELRTDSRRLPVSFVIRGTNYLRAPVDERFARTGAAAEWTSRADRGRSDIPGYYLPHEATFDLGNMLALGLLAAPGGELPLLPSGRARIERVSDQPVAIGDTTVTATLYLIHGIGFSPSPVWLDADLDLVYEGTSWMSARRRGLSDEAATTLNRVQGEVAAARETATARTLARHPARPVAFRDVALYDAVRRQRLAGQTVIVRGNRIEWAGPAASAAIPADAEIIEGVGRTLLPGLFDMHAHMAANDYGLLAIASGVTSVRDLANQIAPLAERRAAWDAGQLIGPRVFTAAMIDGRHPLAGPTELLVSTPEEAAAAVARAADAGYPMVKLYSSLDPALVPVIITEAHRRGMRVGGHVPAGMTMTRAIEAGYDEISHANFWMLGLMGPEVTARTNTPLRLTAIGERGAEIDLASRPVRDLVELVRARGIVLDPTLSVFEDTLAAEPGRPAPSIAAVADRLPATIARAFSGGGAARSEAETARNRAGLARLREMFLMMHRAGVTMVAGTDGITGITLPHELENYVAAGLSPAEALYMATLGAARVAGAGDRLGSIEAGKLADLVLVDGDPTTRIGDLRRAMLVMKDGALFEPAALYRAVGMQPLTDQ